MTGIYLPPILNEETRIASGADIRSSCTGIGASVFQVTSNFTKNHSKGIFSIANPGIHDAVKFELKCDSKKRTERNLNYYISKYSS